MEEKRLALLIDAENASSKYIDAIISELKKYGVITYQRMYGDFTKSKSCRLAQKGIEACHCANPAGAGYSSGKNASDIMLVIDAMDILYQDKTDGFCIVTSDSDFTRLVNRLREEGMFVIGMGKSDASKTFIAACNEYKFLDKIVDEEVKETSKAKNHKESNHDSKGDSITPIGEIKSAINELIQQSENNGEHANLGSTKSNLQRLFPDFDERNYGYSSMRTFIEEATKFETMQKGTAICILRSSDHGKDIEKEVEKFVQKAAASTVELGTLGRMIATEYPDFKYKDYGYARLSKYVSSVPGVQIENNLVTAIL